MIQKRLYVFGGVRQRQRMTSKRLFLWLIGVIAAAIIGWVITSLLDGAFTPLTESEIIDIMRNAPRAPQYPNPYFP